jgi:cytochrome c-type biogenesis protein CcmH
MLRRWFLFVLISILALSSYGSDIEQPLANPLLEQQAEEVFKVIRCAVCNGQSLHDSNAELARDIRIEIRQQLQKGQSVSQIEEFIALRFGSHMLMRPEYSAATYLLWYGPLVMVMLGVVIVWGYVKRK